ncbi:hypothetical protein, partial [Mesorhizobium sp. M00.F.Ca.ET.217.01.1.1]|uniref:hypothetical protein n=1 Tax=Mesorhizobium sp. M00.F.Ca.ET.217.01.1.1 TaxID=2500529 RepID=UPI001AEDF154
MISLDLFRRRPAGVQIPSEILSEISTGILRLLTNPVDFRRGFVLQIDCAWEIGGGSGCQEAADADLASGED